MSSYREKSKRLIQRIGGGGKKKQDVSLAASSTSIPPNDLSATGREHVQQEMSGDSFASAYPASYQQPLAAESMWDHAYHALAQEMPDLVKDFDVLLAKEQMANSVPNETTPSHLPAPHGLDTRFDRSRRQDQLSSVIQNGLRRMEDMEATYHTGGYKFIRANQSTQVTNLLLWGKDWIGSAAKFFPEASLVWAAVCLIFPLLTNPTTAAEANRDGFVYVTSRMRYYAALEPMLRRLGRNARVDDALMLAANRHIVDLYEAILEFQLRSVLRFYQSHIKSYVHDIVPPRDWKQIRLDIKTLEDTVTNDLSQINDLATRQELELLNNMSEDTRAAMQDYLSVATRQLDVSKKQLAAEPAAKREKLHYRQQAEEEKLLAEQRKCLQLFYLTRNGNGVSYDWYKDRVESRVEGTCEWFLQHENFQKWLLQKSGPLLVTADPGCGKSVLAKYLIDHGLAQQSAAICYFFFKVQDQDTICQALCALLHQLFSQKSALIQHAMELYNRMGADLVLSELLLWTILRDAVCDPQAGSVIFVIDALDECDESQLRSLMINLKDIFRDPQLANAKFKVLMTSRPYQQVVSNFSIFEDDFTCILIPGEEEFETIGQEISRVIQRRVEQLAQEHWLSDKTKSSLERKLLAVDHRTYLWVHLVFNYLDSYLRKGFGATEDGIDSAIRTLPTTVNQAYDRILNRSQDDGTSMIVNRALSIILAARRPLTLSEMNIAMNLGGTGRGRSIDNLDLEQDVDFEPRLLELCGQFINVLHDKIYFINQTAREFLIQPSAPIAVSPGLQWHHSISTRHAHSVLAEICMLYLDILNSTPTDTFRQDHQYGALLQYSVEHWGDHCREAEFEKGSAMVDLALELCTSDLTSHSQWTSIILSRYHIRHESSTNALVASHLGLAPVTELLLSRGADIEAKDSHGRTASMLASESGHEAVTRLLLENGADVEARDDDGCTAWMHAARSGDEDVTRLLFKNGANVEVRDDDGWTVLIHAARCGHEAVTRLLIDIGADVEARDDDGWTALIHAARCGHEGVTSLLLENGADVKAKDNKGRTALVDAFHNTRRLLLNNSAQDEASDAEGSTA